LANHPPQFNKLKHPMSSYSVEFIDGHIIAVINNCKYIVDTGSPSSFGNGKININGSNYNISASGMHGLTATSVSNLSGIQVDGLIGMDILSNFDVTFSESEIRFFDAGSTNGQHTPNAISLPLIDKVMGIPIINMTIHNQVRRIFFDTGAKLSYLSDELLTGASVGEDAKEAAWDTKEAVKEGHAKEFYEQAKAKGSEFKREAEELLGDAKRTVEEKATDAYRSVTGEPFNKNVSQAGEWVKEKASEAYEQGKNLAQTVTEKAKEIKDETAKEEGFVDKAKAAFYTVTGQQGSTKDKSA
jgi:hypothetical protein